MPSLFGIECSEEVYEANRHLAAQPKAPKTKARAELDAEAKKQFAATFEATWRLLGGPELEHEYQFCPDRKWRSDYRVGNFLLELDGGVWSGGRHTRGGGYIEDCMKKNAAVLLGYRVICIPTGCATPAYLESLIKAIQSDVS
jgi:hypothetical protein